MRPVVPVLALPLRVRGGAFVVHEQGSTAATLDQAEVALRTRPRTLEAQPGFGLRNLVGELGPVAPDVLEALARDVPDVAFVAHEELAERVRRVTVQLAQEA